MKKLVLALIVAFAFVATPAEIYVTTHNPILPPDGEPQINPYADGTYACDSQADCNAWAAATCGYSYYISYYTTANGAGVACMAICTVRGYPGYAFLEHTANCD